LLAELLISFFHGWTIMPKKELHTKEQIATFLEELKTQSDRGAAVIAAAVLDDLLEFLILQRLINLGAERRESLFGRTGAPLSSFSAKIEMAYALGVIANEMRLGMHLIRDVRNEFAHRIEQITFDHPDVAKIIETRLMGPLQKPGKSNRAKYIDSFSVIAMLIYGVLENDIRIKSLAISHKDQLLQFQEKIRSILQEAKNQKRPSTDPQP
jgi:hypothetical protein